MVSHTGSWELAVAGGAYRRLDASAVVAERQARASYQKATCVATYRGPTTVVTVGSMFLVMAVE